LIQYLITLFIHSRLQFPLAQIAASYVPVSSKSNQSGLRNCPWVGVGRSPSFSQNVSNSSNSKCWHRPNLDVDIIQGALGSQTSIATKHRNLDKWMSASNKSKHSPLHKYRACPQKLIPRLAHWKTIGQTENHCLHTGAQKNSSCGRLIVTLFAYFSSHFDTGQDFRFTH